MMSHKLHTYFMAGALVIGVVLLLTGTGGTSPFLFLFLACMAMMFFMMRGMGGMGGHGVDGGKGGQERDESDHPHDHASTPR